MNTKFKPSPESKTPTEEAVRLLRIIHRTAEIAEALVVKVDDLPVWEMERLRQAAGHLAHVAQTLNKEMALARLKPVKSVKPAPKRTRRRSNVVKTILDRAKAVQEEEGGT